jgi:pimeloyl-ACP methyl ester carboxylesterase
VKHGRIRVNGNRMHYITAGSGPALLLLHSTPKNSFYWYHLFPLPTDSFTVVAPDLRGFGYTDKPPATDGYDSMTNDKDMVDLITQLGHEKFLLHGEDRGAEYAYVLAASHRDRVIKLSFREMLLSGLGLEESSFLTKDNATAQFEQRGVWCWHLTLFALPHVPEMLVIGKKREFREILTKQECHNPSSMEQKALDHRVECAK